VTTMSAIYWDPFDEEIDTSPHEIWRRMRAEMPLYRNDKYDFWALSRHADVHAAHVNPQTYLSGYGTVLELMGSDMSSTGQMIFMDGQQHNKMRLLVSKAFTRSRVAALEERIRQFSCELLDAQAGSGGFDYLDDFGAQLPSLVISSLLGVSPADRPAVLELINTVFHIEPDVGMMNDVSFGARIGLNTYLIEQLADRRRTPRDDMITALTEAELTEDGKPRRLNDQEAADFANLLISAGTETVARLLGWAAVILADHPDQRADMANDSGLIPGAVEELLRYEAPSPVQGRTLSRPVELHGETLPTGAKILLLTGSAGRDERVWERADDFDVKRKPEQHVSFGIGAHFCLGAALARMEGRIALEETLTRFPSWNVDHAHAVRLHTSTVRGYKSVPIVL
jgi:cytochrome P450